MKPWQRHTLGLVLPLVIAVIVFASAPEYDAPAWMINVSVAATAVAIMYGTFAITGWMKRKRNHAVVSFGILALGLAGWGLGKALNSQALTALVGLVPVAAALAFLGFLARWEDRSGSRSAEKGPNS